MAATSLTVGDVTALVVALATLVTALATLVKTFRIQSGQEVLHSKTNDLITQTNGNVVQLVTQARQLGALEAITEADAELPPAPVTPPKAGA